VFGLEGLTVNSLLLSSNRSRDTPYLGPKCCVIFEKFFEGVEILLVEEAEEWMDHKSCRQTANHLVRFIGQKEGILLMLSLSRILKSTGMIEVHNRLMEDVLRIGESK
jgi:hypothetical protein